MYDNRFFDFMMQNEALKKTMLLNKVALIIFEAVRMWQETMDDISVEDASDAQNIAKLFFERLDVNKSNEFSLRKV